MGYKIAALKLLIMVPNLVFFAAGLCMIYKGTEGLTKYSEYDGKHNLDPEKTKATLAVGLAVGLSQCLVSFFAFFGTLADKRAILKAYAIIIFFEIVFQIVVAFMIFRYSDELDEITTMQENEGNGMDTLKMHDYSIGVTVFVCFDVCLCFILSFTAWFLAAKLKEHSNS